MFTRVLGNPARDFPGCARGAPRCDQGVRCSMARPGSAPRSPAAGKALQPGSSIQFRPVGDVAVPRQEHPGGGIVEIGLEGLAPLAVLGQADSHDDVAEVDHTSSPSSRPVRGELLPAPVCFPSARVAQAVRKATRRRKPRCAEKCTSLGTRSSCGQRWISHYGVVCGSWCFGVAQRPGAVGGRGRGHRTCVASSSAPGW